MEFPTELPKEMIEEAISSQMGLPGRLYQNFKAYKLNAELKNSDNPIKESAMKCGILAAIGGTIALAAKFMTEKDGKKYQLIDDADSIYNNPELSKALFQLQTFRDLEPLMFKDLIELIERLVHLEHVLHSQMIAPRPADRWDAMDYHIQIHSLLQQFQYLISNDMDAEYAVAAERLVSSIKGYLNIYYANLMTMTSEFHIENTLQRAPADVAKAAQRYRKQQLQHMYRQEYV